MSNITTDAIPKSMYNKRPELWWIGRRVVCLVDLKNSWFTAPRGTVFVIDGKQGGFSLRLAEPCSCCGLKGSVTKVPFDRLALLGAAEDGAKS